jgi:integral membrane protein
MQFQGLLRFDTPTARLRAVAFLEGSSFLLLLFVAMPLKYVADLPLAVRIVGIAHGVLFIGLALQALAAVRARGKSLGWGARLGVAALLPFGTYFCDRGLAADDEAFRRAAR